MFVRPHLDYGDIIYHIPVNINDFDLSLTLHPLMERVERVQYQAALAITGTWQGTNRNKLYEELGWENLCDRRWLRRLIQIYKMHNRISPKYLYDYLPPPRSLLCGQVSHTYHNLACNSIRYMNSFLPNAIQIWYEIGNEFHVIPNIKEFKKKIINIIRPPSNSVYGINSIFGLKLIFQLRVGLSPLKAHKRKHNFLDTPTDWCDCHCSPETTVHFLLSCCLHDRPRDVLHKSIKPILQQNDVQDLIDDYKLYLYGNSLLSHADNKKILLSSITFIKNTKRLNKE